VGMVINERSLPGRPEVQSACELLGLDPLYVANEGKVVFFVAPEAAEAVLAILRTHPLGRDAARIGMVTGEHRGSLVARTAMGANRVISIPVGEQLPRIC
jgi:hydrogenase expression/formation protein HypE